MTDDTDVDSDDVTVSMEITGPYDDVVSKLAVEGDRSGVIDPLVSDVEALLETVVRIDGGTRSALASAVPPDAGVAGDPQAVVETLQVLARYDLVVLEGNTWTPGPALDA
jgi:hypothetical protein